MRFTVFVILLIGIFCSANGQSLTDSLKAWYPFNSNAIDESGNINDGVVNSATLTTDRFGVASSAYFFNGSSANIELPSDFDFPVRTVSFWFNASSITPGSSNTMYDSDHSFLMNGKTGFNVNNVVPGNNTSLNYGNTANMVNINLNEWYMLTITVSDSTRKYICDSLIATLPINPIHSSSGNLYASLGKTRLNDRFFHGKIDDVRIYNRALSQVEIQALCEVATLPIELMSFVALSVDNRVLLKWATASEINNAYFSIDRSKDALNWEVMATVNGAGNSTSTINYRSIDEDPHHGVSYYRLKQTDINGEHSYSEIESVNIDQLSNGEIDVSPNPTSNRIAIEGTEEELNTIKIYNMLGQDISNLTQTVRSNSTIITLDLSNLSDGMYWLITKSSATKVYKM